MTWQRVLRVGGTMLLAGLSAFGAATLVVGFDLGFEAAIMAGIAAFFANVFMIDGLARDKVLRDRCRHYERALRTIIANPTKAAEYAQSALDMGMA